MTRGVLSTAKRCSAAIARCAFFAGFFTGAVLCSCGNTDLNAPPAVPQAPLVVRAAGASLTGITVTWVRVLNATSYNVFRGERDTGTFTFVKTVAVDTCRDTGLVAGNTYYYKVTAVNDLGESEKSAAVDATTGFPGNVAAKGISASVISVSWAPVAGATLYNAYRGSSDTGDFLAVGLVTGDTFIDSGLGAGTMYYYKVSAAAGTRESRLSQPAHAITIAAAPLGLETDTILTKIVSIFWLPATGAASYKVYRNPGDTSAYAAVGTCVSDTFIDTGLSGGSRYNYSVTAINASGESAKSTPLAVLTVPSAPKIVVDSMLPGPSVLIAWNAVKGAASYNVFRGDSVNPAPVLVSAAVTDTFFTDTGLEGGTGYYYQTTAINGSGESDPSALDTVRTSE
jgi:fibronectin type 3 domain-containing protein